jgi:hypothetical protein
MVPATVGDIEPSVWLEVPTPIGVETGRIKTRARDVSQCCRSKPTGEQRQATRGAGRLPGLLVGPGPSVNGPAIWRTPWLGEVLGVPPDLYLIRKV